MKTPIQNALERERKLLASAKERRIKYGLALSTVKAHEENVAFLENIQDQDKQQFIEGYVSACLNMDKKTTKGFTEIDFRHWAEQAFKSQSQSNN